jgi:hypothetical protein
MMDLVVSLLPALLKLTTASIKVVAASTMQTLHSVMMDPSMLPLVNRFVQAVKRSQQGNQRRQCMLVIRHILRVHSADDLSKYQTVLKDGLTAGESDKLSETRAVASESRDFFNFHFQVQRDASSTVKCVFPEMPRGVANIVV